MNNTKPLIEQVKADGELQPIREKLLRAYYTCVRYSNTELHTSSYSGPMGTPLTYYGPGQWSCMKGWFETYDNTSRGKMFDHKVIDFCKYRDTITALEEKLGKEFIIVNSS